MSADPPAGMRTSQPKTAETLDRQTKFGRQVRSQRDFENEGNEYINYNVPGAFETYFSGINDQGRICGYYRTSDSVRHGMILQVVE